MISAGLVETRRVDASLSWTSSMPGARVIKSLSLFASRVENANIVL